MKDHTVGMPRASQDQMSKPTSESYFCTLRFKPQTPLVYLARCLRLSAHVDVCWLASQGKPIDPHGGYLHPSAS
ncbi:hypothetical protein TNCT_212291 [Trichonephila clavata]|uniref:Uncharacterized protein n=1 Tax=Trichonephila clavata TaxID=2740835 RepID=A0A8X6HX73_TRICU|nr:hypothetical protein TNCT_212291 [Trichonephila clavata]